MCHGAGAVGGGVLADLRYMSAETHEKFNAITLGGLYVDKGMVGFASRLSEQDGEDIHAFLVGEAFMRQEDPGAHLAALFGT